MEDRLRIGVIGTGMMGRNHVRAILEEKDSFELVGIFDTNKSQAKIISESFATVAFDDMEELLDEVTAVVIAVPSSLHLTVGMKAAQKKVHALIEKPLASNSEDARILSEAFESDALKLMVGHIERFNPVIPELEKILNDEEIIAIESHRFSTYDGRIFDVSVVEDLMIHDVELICHLLKKQAVKSISGFGESVETDRLDFATGIIQYNSGVYAIISSSRVSQGKERLLRVHTKKALIEADLLHKTLSITRNSDFSLLKIQNNTYRQESIIQRVFVPQVEPLRMELLSFCGSVLNDSPIITDGISATDAIRLCERIVRRASE